MTPDIELMIASTDKLNIINIYRPPSGNISNFIHELTNKITNLNKVSTIVMGDFNINFNNSSKHTISLINNLLDNKLINSTTVPTRHTDTTATRIDAIFAPTNIISNHGVLTTDISDHFTPFLTIKLKREKLKTKPQPYRKLDKETLTLISKKLTLMDTHSAWTK